MHMNLMKAAERRYKKPNLENFSKIGTLILTKRRISSIIIMKIREERVSLSTINGGLITWHTE